MQWGSLENFLTMGGYGFYVWSAYGMTALMIAVEIWQLRSRRAQVVADLSREARARKNSEKMR
ncbi:MAG: heme exporter protein CcmD [Burkholderiaceae bacterium]